MGATASFPDRKHAERALWERMSSLDEACDALDARSATASEARARRRLINGARSVYHGLRAAHSASEALDNALAALSARREAVASFELASPRYRAAANDALDDAQRENDRALVAWREAVAAVAVRAAGVASDAARTGDPATEHADAAELRRQLRQTAEVAEPFATPDALTAAHLAALVPPVQSEEDAEVLAVVSRLFALMDRNGDGYVSAPELREHLGRIVAPGPLLRALNAASIDDAADALLAKLDVDGDGRVSLDEFQRGFDILSAHDQLRVDPIKGLAPHDFTGLWHEKHAAHLLGTREWAFAEIGAWLDEPDASQLFWLMCVGTREAARGRPL
jgi:hypothetical protein